MIVYTDLREYRRGDLPEDMQLPWTSAISATVEGATFDLPHKSSLRLVSSGTRAAINWLAPSQDAGYNNQESLSLVRMISAGADNGLPRPMLRGSGGSVATSSGYMLYVPTSGNMRIQKLVNNTVTDLAPNVAKTFPVGTLVFMKFRANGTNLQAKAWAFGDAEPGWDISIPDATHASGWVGFHVLQSGLTADVQYWCVATNGDTTTDFASIAPPLDSWAMEPDDDLDISAKFTFYDPVLGAVRTQWLARFSRTTGPRDYPSLTPMSGALIDAGSLTARVEADAHLASLAAVSRAPLRISNRPVRNNTLGPLADWEDYSFYGYPIEIRIGRRWAVKPSGSNEGVRNDHRRYEIVACGEAKEEPQVGVPEVSFNWGPMVTLSEKLNVRRFIGIATGVKNLSSLGWLSIPPNTAYDRSSFNLAFNLIVPMAGVAGVSTCTICQRQNDATHRQWSVTLGQVSHATLANRLQFNVDTGAGASLISTSSPSSVALGRPVPVLLSVKSGELWYCYVDGTKIGSGTLSSSPHIASGQIVEVLRNSAIGALIFDLRIEQWLPEEMSRGRYSSRMDIDQFNISMFRCDDATGNIVTDFNTTTANHGTLQGTNNIDRAWYPTYYGTVDLAGSPMPVAAGVVYHGGTKNSDGLREIYRFTDGARTAGTTLAIKSQGATLTPGANWAEPSDGLGTVDIVGAVAQPVTFAMSPSGSTDDPKIHLPQLVRDELVARGHLSTSNGDLDSFLALRSLFPFRGGFNLSDPPTISDLLNRAIGHSILGFYGESRHGRLYTGSYLSPINPGPYGQEPMLEFLGLPNRGVTFSSNAAFNLNNDLYLSTPLWGLAAWIKIPRAGWSDSSATMGTYFPTGMTIIDRVAGSAGYYFGIDGRNGAIVFGAPGITGATTGLHYLSYRYLFEAGKSYFIFCTQDSNTRTIAVASQDDPTVAITYSLSELTTGAMTVPSSAPLLIGHGPRGSFYGYIGYVIGSSSGLSAPNFVQTVPPYDIRTARWSQSAVTSASWTQTRYLINLNEGRDTVLESKSGLTGYVEGARWCPRLTLDLRKRASLQGAPPRNTSPIWKAEVRYRTNYQVIKNSDVAGSVSASERIALGQQWLAGTGSSLEMKSNYKGSKEVPLDSLLYSAADADAIAAMLRARVAPGRKFGDVQNCDRSALRLNPSDEILLYANSTGFQSGRPLRVYSLFHALGLLKSSIGGWG